MNRPLWMRLIVAALALAAPSATASASGTMTVGATGRPFAPPPPPAVIDTTPGQVSEPLKDGFCGTCV
ncbi:hypothetical protein Drose_35045 [Dactylosporangium roseum]|uniref:Uncharacterized protein n=1 Tax=Dactylosporangium roseum TaxID=47989 RepID=A0ABY5Z433_9ACTN|nr:hypothetical protein [Dactylosporangium roseum]UWZ36217.1 hypothetical protein Drose_35045 [Dactylosporangium roseum]